MPGAFLRPREGANRSTKMENRVVVVAEQLVEQARRDLARKRMAALRRQRERMLFTLERRAVLTVKETSRV